MSRHNILCRNRVLPRLRDFVLRQENYVATWLAKQGDFCHDRIFYVATELAKVRRKYVMTGNGGSIKFSVATGLFVSQ